MENICLSGGGFLAFLIHVTFFNELSSNLNMLNYKVLEKYNIVSSVSSGSWFINNLIKNDIKKTEKYLPFLLKKEIFKNHADLLHNFFKNKDILSLLKLIKVFKQINWSEYIQNITTLNLEKEIVEDIKLKWCFMHNLSNSGINDNNSSYIINDFDSINPVYHLYTIKESTISDSKVFIPKCKDIVDVDYYYRNNKIEKTRIELETISKLIEDKTKHDEIFCLSISSNYLGIFTTANITNFNNEGYTFTKFIKKVIHDLLKASKKKRKKNILDYFKDKITSTKNIDKIIDIFLNQIKKINLTNLLQQIKLNKKNNLNFMDDGYLDNTGIVSNIYFNQKENNDNFTVHAIVYSADVNDYKQGKNCLYVERLFDNNVAYILNLDNNNSKIFNLDKENFKNEYEKNNVQILHTNISCTTVENDFFKIKKNTKVTLNIIELFVNEANIDLHSEIILLGNKNLNFYREYISNIKTILNENKEIIESLM